MPGYFFEERIVNSATKYCISTKYRLNISETNVCIYANVCVLWLNEQFSLIALRLTIFGSKHTPAVNKCSDSLSLSLKCEIPTKK